MSHGDQPEQHESSNDGNIKIAMAVFLTFMVPVVGHGILTWRDVSNLTAAVARIESDVKLLDATIAVVAAETHANSIHREEHDKSAGHWIETIKENERAIRRLERETRTGTDPFTGTEGANLRARIERLERKDKEKIMK